MKKIMFCLILGGLFLEEMTAQTVQWAVRPTSAQLEGYGDLLKMRKNGKCGLIDHNNRTIVAAQYDSISPFRDGYALAMNYQGRQMKIEAVISEGDYELMPLTETLYATRYMWFSDGKMPVKGNGGWGYLGTDGNVAIPCQFQAAHPFSEGFASVMIDDKAYYIDRNMDYLPVEVGYGNLVFASTFSGNEAIVYSGNSYTPKGYVINRRGRIVRSYKVKPDELKVNKYDHSVGDKSQIFNSQVSQLPVDSHYSVYEEKGLYGYKKNGVIVLPAQLDKAEQVRGDYANVRYKGQNGVLHMVEGNFSMSLESKDIEIKGSQSDKGCLNVNIPSALEDAAIRLRMYDRQGNEMYLQANNSQGEHRSYSFHPTIIPNQSNTLSYRVEIWNDNLMLWSNNCSINYIVKKEPKDNPSADVVEKPKLTIASLSLSAPKASSKRANPKNDFYVTVTVRNSGDERGNGVVSLSVDGQPVGSKNIGVRGHGSANAIFAVSNIRKERYAKVRATLKNGNKSQEASIHFMPFY